MHQFGWSFEVSASPPAPPPGFEGSACQPGLLTKCSDCTGCEYDRELVHLQNSLGAFLRVLS